MGVRKSGLKQDFLTRCTTKLQVLPKRWPFENESSSAECCHFYDGRLLKIYNLMHMLQSFMRKVNSETDILLSFSVGV